MKTNLSRRAVATLFAAAACAGAQTSHVGPNSVEIRGRRQDVHYLAGHDVTADAAHNPVLFVAGDGGWTGFGLEVASTLASWGHDVYGFDTRRYLESFTGGGTALTENQVMEDMGQLG
jgi:type IV secretory pathway VirJ component